MPVTTANNRITISGTYTSLATIMADFQAAGGTFSFIDVGAKRIYSAPNWGLEIAASAVVSWNNEIHELVCSRTMPTNTVTAFVMGANSRLTIGREYVQRGKTLRTKGFGLRFDRSQTEPFSTARGMSQASSATLTVYGDIQFAQPWLFDGQVNIYGDIYNTAPSSASDPGLRQGLTSTFIHEGSIYSIEGGRPTRVWVNTGNKTVPTVRSLSSRFENVLIHAQGGSGAPV
jgi:hypothetical protein